MAALLEAALAIGGIAAISTGFAGGVTGLITGDAAGGGVAAGRTGWLEGGVLGVAALGVG